MAKKKIKAVPCRYSGEKSTNFWKIVNSIDDECDRQEIYSLGVALQNMEAYVLKQLAHVNPDFVNEDITTLG